MIALGQSGITSAEGAKTLKKRWAAYREAHTLDPHGRPVLAAKSAITVCEDRCSGCTLYFWPVAWKI
jgi:hypothetical protein